MPCLNGRFPVAMEVHSIGESGGCSVAICPETPLVTSDRTLGMRPALMSGWMTFQSAESHPTRRTLRLVGRAPRLPPTPRRPARLCSEFMLRPDQAGGAPAAGEAPAPQSESSFIAAA